MPILNYTTTISVHKTIGEIQETLAKAGAMAVSVDYADGQPIALMFIIRIWEKPISFRLPSRYDGVFARLNADPKVPKASKNEDQARRVAWRILKDWIEAQMAVIEAGQAELAEVFLPYAVTRSGMTLFQEIENQPQFLLLQE